MRSVSAYRSQWWKDRVRKENALEQKSSHRTLSSGRRNSEGIELSVRLPRIVSRSSTISESSERSKDSSGRKSFSKTSYTPRSARISDYIPASLPNAQHVSQLRGHNTSGAKRIERAHVDVSTPTKFAYSRVQRPKRLRLSKVSPRRLEESNPEVLSPLGHVDRSTWQRYSKLNNNRETGMVNWDYYLLGDTASRPQSRASECVGRKECDLTHFQDSVQFYR
eukprot:164023_1